MTDETRTDPPRAGSEVDTLVGFLEFLRESVARKAAGLDRDQLAQRLDPSTMTLGGMLKHLAYVEDWWFTQVLRGEAPQPPFDDVDWKADADWDWHSAVDHEPDELRALWAGLVDVSRRQLAEVLATPEGLDALSVRTSHRTGERFSLRWILVHMIEEYARHAGHADLIRESIDGQTGE